MTTMSVKHLALRKSVLSVGALLACRWVLAHPRRQRLRQSARGVVLPTIAAEARVAGEAVLEVCTLSALPTESS